MFPKRVVTHTIVGAVFVGGGVGLAVLAQTDLRPPGIHKSAAQIDQELVVSTPALGIQAGQSTRIVEDGDGRITVRRRLAGPNNASVHEDVTEVYHILGGSGTVVTGGTLPDYDGDRTTGITGGRSYDVKAGDWVVLPPGTPHWFSQINEEIKYLEVRIPQSN